MRATPEAIRKAGSLQNYLRAMEEVTTDRQLIFDPGDYPGDHYVTDRHGLNIQGEGRVVFRGGKTALKFERCNNLTLVSVAGCFADLYGIMVADSVGFKGTNLWAEQNGKTGLLTANVSDVEIAGGRFNRNVTEHGVYCSQSGDNIRIIGIESSKNGRCAVQINAHDERPKRSDPRRDSKTVGFLISGLTAVGNQGHAKGGAAAINLACCSQGEIRGVDIREHLGRHLIALWDDGLNNPEYACHNVHVFNGSGGFAHGRGKAMVSVGKGCSKITVDPAFRLVRDFGQPAVPLYDGSSGGDLREAVEEFLAERPKKKKRKNRD
jgi:hypothetical protein